MNNTNSTETEQSESGRAAANRANSQHSTGPRSDAGKKRSSLNALRHGLTSQIVVMPEEDLTAYQLHARTYFDDFKPKGAVEQQLVQALADTAWRLNRIPALEANVLTLGMHAHTGAIDLEIDKESHHAEVRAALATAQAVHDSIRTLSSLSMHDHRLTRKFESTLKQLTALQAARNEREKSELAEAAKLLEMHQEKDLPYDPSEDGFVLTNGEIATYLKRKHRAKDADNAATRRYWAA
jgi:hypothetical protein